MNREIELYKAFMEGLLNECRIDMYTNSLINGNRVFPAVGDENLREFCNALSPRAKRP